MASGRRLRTRTSSGVPTSQQQQLSDCGHDRSQLDLSGDRDLPCKVCWSNREILIQRLIEPFENALETLQDEGASGSANSTPERGVVVSSGDAPVGGRSRSLRRRAGKKRTRSASPTAATTPMGIDGEDLNLLGSGGPGAVRPDEEDCIHVQDISVVTVQRPQKKRSKSPPDENKSVKIAALEPQKASTNIIPPTKGRNMTVTTEKMQENPSPPVDYAATTKLPKVTEKAPPTPPTLPAKLPKQKQQRTSQVQPPKKGQQTLFSFFSKSAEGATVKTEETNAKPVTIFSAGGNSSGPRKRDVGTPKANEEIVVRTCTKVASPPPPPAPPARAGTRKSARDVTVKSRETINYREDSDSDIDLD
ncbi:uncharacterized protein H6S33_007633 [Morchella sextelata]|uniref:uncharacterized protein n=1 Tax=Morchella sextelata TaxID=1174677 RepID=UPI001D04EBC7|nr:uncharacterized protein H6S33_007633 [Morchella sextelata]KAH0603311.1 hypothetical protein H6S33_007633 [Morchella sextelata]